MKRFGGCTRCFELVLLRKVVSRSLVREDNRTQPFDNLTTMFTFLCCLFLVTFAFPSACHKDCWFTKKTRGSLKDCYGKVLPLTADLARGLGVEQGEAYACFKHRRALAKEDDRCSSVLLKNHSKKLLAIPQKLYQFLDDRGKTVDNYRPGGKWCNNCRTLYYREFKTNIMVSGFYLHCSVN